MDRFSALPEVCISDILSLTSPRDVCRSSAMCQGINAAADADSIWESFLPSDYREIISRSLSPVMLSPVVFPTKKRLFFGLSDSPILIDEGNMSFGLDKASGKKCYMIGARLLTIFGANYEYDWRWISLPESRFAEVAQLKIICNLKIKGRINIQILSRNISYAAYLVYKIIEQNNSGLDGLGIKASVRFVNESLDTEDGNNHSIVYIRRSSRYSHQTLDGRLPRNRSDGWEEVELGEFISTNGGEVEIILLGRDPSSLKTGLIIQGIELRPKVTL